MKTQPPAPATTSARRRQALPPVVPWLRLGLCLLMGLGAHCASDDGAPAEALDAEGATRDGAHADAGLWQVQGHALSSISCQVSKATGYKSGKPFTIHVVHVDGKPVEVHTANAYYVMAQAAAKAGVQLAVVSGFRTMAQQQTLYNCYKCCCCNSCNLAAVPGTSNHQSGHALDLNTSATGVYSWLNKHGQSFGWKRTVPSEAWHWEW